MSVNTRDTWSITGGLPFVIRPSRKISKLAPLPKSMIPMISFTMLRRKSMYTPPPYSTPINMMNKSSIPLIAILGYREQDGQHHADNHYIDPQIKKQRRANQPDNGNGLVEPQS